MRSCRTTTTMAFWKRSGGISDETPESRDDLDVLYYSQLEFLILTESV